MIDYYDMHKVLSNNNTKLAEGMLESEKQEKKAYSDVLIGYATTATGDEILGSLGEIVCGYGDIIPIVGDFTFDIYSAKKENEEIEAHNIEIDEKIVQLKESSYKSNKVTDYAFQFYINMEIISKDGEFKVQRTSMDKNELLNDLDKYNKKIFNEYCDDNQEIVDGLSQEEIWKLKEIQENFVTINDVKKYFSEDCDDKTMDKVKNYRSYVNK